MNDLADIVKRLEMATGPIRELDTEIFRAIGWEAKDVLEGASRAEQLVGYLCRKPGDKHWTPTPHVTRSLDAALKLVPEGLDYELLHLRTDGKERGEASVYLKKYMAAHEEERTYGESSCDAIALCIAALKARQAARIVAGTTATSNPGEPT